MGTDPINFLKWYRMVLETTSATVKQNAGHKFFKTPLWKLQNWTSTDKRSQVITENSRLQKEQHMDSFHRKMLSPSFSSQRNVALPFSKNSSNRSFSRPEPSLVPLLYYSSLPLQRSQNIKEMWLFTSPETRHQDCSYAFRHYSSCGITTKKSFPNYYS